MLKNGSRGLVVPENPFSFTAIAVTGLVVPEKPFSLIMFVFISLRSIDAMNKLDIEVVGIDVDGIIEGEVVDGFILDGNEGKADGDVDEMFDGIFDGMAVGLFSRFASGSICGI